MLLQTKKRFSHLAKKSIRETPLTREIASISGTVRPTSFNTPQIEAFCVGYPLNTSGGL